MKFNIFFLFIICALFYLIYYLQPSTTVQKVNLPKKRISVSANQILKKTIKAPTQKFIPSDKALTCDQQNKELSLLPLSEIDKAAFGSFISKNCIDSKDKMLLSFLEKCSQNFTSENIDCQKYLTFRKAQSIAALNKDTDPRDLNSAEILYESLHLLRTGKINSARIRKIMAELVEKHPNLYQAHKLNALTHFVDLVSSAGADNTDKNQNFLDKLSVLDEFDSSEDYSHELHTISSSITLAPEEAISFFEEKNMYRSDKAIDKYVIACFYYRQGMRKKGRDYLKLAMRMAPGNQRYQQAYNNMLAKKESACSLNYNWNFDINEFE